MSKRTVCYLADKGLIEGREILMRVDFNVPFEDGQIADETRLERALPTIRFLLERQARLVLCSHLGRPQKKPVSVWPAMSLEPVAKRLGEMLGVEVGFAYNCVGKEILELRAALEPGQVMLLENTRFHSGEEMNSAPFAKALAGDSAAFVNDAFGSCHRAHASTDAVCRAIGDRPCVMGFLVERELEVLQGILDHPERNLVVILGGAKVADKIGVVRNLLQIANKILIGGGMSYTFLKANGYEIGGSLLDEKSLDDVVAVQKEAREKGVELLLPTDVVVAPRFAADAPATIVSADAIPPDQEGLDMGPQTTAAFIEAIGDADVVFWNGPLGVFEFEPFAVSTNALAKALTECGAEVVIGGGDSASAVADFADQMYHICTGGGASLEFLEGHELPGIRALDDA